MADALLLDAASRGKRDDVEVLLEEEDANVNARNRNNNTPLHFAAARGDVPMLHLLIDYGADVNARDDDTLGGCTSLHYAVQMNNFEAVETLLQAGADPNIADTTHGWSPLHLAVRLKNNTIAKLLITKGADVEQRDSSGNNPSYWAKEIGNDAYLASEGVPPPATATAEERVMQIHLQKQKGIALGISSGKKKAGKKGGKKKGKKKKKK